MELFAGVARLRRSSCPEKALDLLLQALGLFLLQALGLFCEFAGRVENQFDGISHLARCPRHVGNVLHDALRALCGLLHVAGNFLG